MPYQLARDPEEARANYVWIDDDGGAHELTAEQADHLAAAYDPFDGARPYVKSRYRSRTPVGSMRGYLERRLLPWRLAGVLADAKDFPSAPVRPAGRRARDALLAVVVATVVGYFGALMGSILFASLMHLVARPVAVTIFAIGAGVLAARYVTAGVLRPLYSLDRWRLLRFLAMSALCLGVTGGGAWVLWYGGDPSRLRP